MSLRTIGGSFENYVIEVPTDYINEFEKKMLDKLASLKVINFEDSEMEKLSAVLSALTEKKWDNDSLQYIQRALFGYLVYLLTDIYDKYQANNNLTRHTSLVKNIIQYINEHYAEKITLDDLSNRFFTSKVCMCIKFKKETGKSIIDTLLNIRIDNAKFLLKNTKLPMEKIAEQCGFF